MRIGEVLELYERINELETELADLAKLEVDEAAGVDIDAFLNMCDVAKVEDAWTDADYASEQDNRYPF